MAVSDIRVQELPFDVAAELKAVMNTGAGAVVNFVGQVRGAENDAPIQGLFLEHYPGMTEKALSDIADQAHARWSLSQLVIIHRYGELPVGAPIVLVIAAASHRKAAFEACGFVMDYLKTDAPFWKKTMTPDGGQWIEAKDSDALEKARWDAQ